MTLIKLCNLKCIRVEVLWDPVRQCGSDSHQIRWQKLYLMKTRGVRHRFKTREQKQSEELQPMCWERLQENSKAASLCGWETLTGQWSEETPTKKKERPSFTERDLVQLWFFPLGLAHAHFGWCQKKVQRRSWDFMRTLKTVALSALWYTTHLQQQSKAFKSPFPPFNETLAAAKRREPWASSHGLFGCFAATIFVMHRPSGKRNLRREETGDCW